MNACFYAFRSSLKHCTTVRIHMNLVNIKHCMGTDMNLENRFKLYNDASID